MLRLFKSLLRKRKPLSPFPEPELRKWFIYSGMSPEVYAAKRGHRIGCFSFGDFSYKDKELERWLYRFAEIFSSLDQMESCRKEHLSEDEYREVKQYLEDLMSGKIEF